MFTIGIILTTTTVHCCMLDSLSITVALSVQYCIVVCLFCSAGELNSTITLINVVVFTVTVVLVLFIDILLCSQLVYSQQLQYIVVVC